MGKIQATLDSEDHVLRGVISNFVEVRAESCFDWIDAGEFIDEIVAYLIDKEPLDANANGS